MLLFNTLATLASAYSVFVVVLSIVYFHLKRKYGMVGSTEKINWLAGSKMIVAFQFYSMFSLGVWTALVLPWVDLFTFQKFSHYQDGGLQTYFGWMTGREAIFYFLLTFFNILGAKAAMMFVELAGLLRQGRIQMFQDGLLMFWKPE